MNAPYCGKKQELTGTVDSVVDPSPFLSHILHSGRDVILVAVVDFNDKRARVAVGFSTPAGRLRKAFFIFIEKGDAFAAFPRKGDCDLASDT